MEERGREGTERKSGNGPLIHNLGYADQMFVDADQHNLAYLAILLGAGLIGQLMLGPRPALGALLLRKF